MNTRPKLVRLVAAHTRLSGLKVDDTAAAWTAAGMLKLLRAWPDVPSGSPLELETLLSLFDAKVHVECRRKSTSEPQAISPVAAAALGSCHVEITWSRFKLASLGRRTFDAVGRILDWWCPPRIDRLTWECGWVDTPLMSITDDDPDLGEQAMTSNSDELLLQYCRLHGVKRRRAIPPRTLLSIAVERPLVLPRRHLVVATSDLRIFLSNRREESLAWSMLDARSNAQPRGGERAWTLIPLADDLTYVELLVVNATPGESWLLNGVDAAVIPDSGWPERVRLELPEPTCAGRGIELRWTPETAENSSSPQVFINPVECRTVVQTNRHWEPMLGDVALAPRLCENPIAGYQGVRAVRQPLGLRPLLKAESDVSIFRRARSLLSKRTRRAADIASATAAEFDLDEKSVSIRPARWLDGVAPPRLCEGIEVEIANERDAQPDRVQAIADFVQRRTSIESDVRVRSNT